jgi:hypothetical protein
MYKLKYNKYKLKYLSLKHKLHQTGGNDYEYYFLHPTNITSINDAFGNKFLCQKIKAINELLLKPYDKVSPNDKLTSENEIEYMLEEINESNEYYCIINLQFIIYKFKNLACYKSYDTLLKQQIDDILDLILKYFKDNKIKSNIIHDYNLLNKILNPHNNADIIIEELDKYLKYIKDKYPIVKKHQRSKSPKLLRESDKTKSIPDKTENTDTKYINLNMKIVHIIKEGNIIIVLVLNYIKQQEREYIDFFIIKSQDKSNNIPLNIKLIDDIISKNKSAIIHTCLNKYIPLNVIGLLNNKPIINYDDNKKNICIKENLIEDDKTFAITNTPTTPINNSIINFVKKLLIDKKLFQMFHSYLINQIKKSINIINISELNKFIIIATSLELFFTQNILYYNDGNTNHAEQALLSKHTDISEIYIIKFSYTEQNLLKLLNNEITQKEFNNLLITLCGIPCQSCLDIIKAKGINNIFLSNHYGEIIKLDESIEQTYRTNGDVFINFDEYLYGLYSSPIS